MPLFNDPKSKNIMRQIFTSQTWWGKIIGAFMGYLIGGPAGAFFGILIGNFFAKGLAEHFSQPYWHFHSESREQVQKKFFEATFLVLGHIAKVDGRVTELEIKMALSLMQDMRLSRSQKVEAKKLFKVGKADAFNLKNTLTQLRHALKDNPELLKLFVETQYQAASVDGLTQNKINAINTMLLYLGFAPLHQQNRFYSDYDYSPFNESHQRQHQNHRRHSNYNYQRAGHSNSPLSQAYAILEIPESSDKAQVKKAYRRLMSKNHPDKLISKGLPEEMIRMANDKAQKISKAYDQICKAKGW